MDEYGLRPAGASEVARSHDPSSQPADVVLDALREVSIAGRMALRSGIRVPPWDAVGGGWLPPECALIRPLRMAVAAAAAAAEFIRAKPAGVAHLRQNGAGLAGVRPCK